ncbi:MAG: type IV secretion system protein [Gammaproteobacteria bacterium]|nr:type IV secretion system protein [Gammaproteobacteria bacterium]
MSNNPYIEGAAGKKEWDDRYMNIAKSKKNYQIAMLISLIAVVILALALTVLAMSSRIQPFVIDTNNGMPYAMQPLSSTSIHNEKIVNFVANQFIINSRTILSDPEAEKEILNKVYAYAGDSAIKTLHDYYQQYNPLENAQKYKVDVNIVNSMPLGKNTWQVVWDETKRANDGSEESKTRWMADLTYQFGQVNSRFINDNPFGLYITTITWSQSTGA